MWLSFVVQPIFLLGGSVLDIKFYNMSVCLSASMYNKAIAEMRTSCHVIFIIFIVMSCEEILYVHTHIIHTYSVHIKTILLTRISVFS